MATKATERYDLFGPSFTVPKCGILQDEATRPYAYDCNENAARVNSLAALYFESSFQEHCLNPNGSINQEAFSHHYPAKSLPELTPEGFINLGQIHFVDESTLPMFQAQLKSKSVSKLCPVCKESMSRAIEVPLVRAKAESDSDVLDMMRHQEALTKAAREVQFEGVEKVQAPPQAVIPDSKYIETLFLIELAYYYQQGMYYLPRNKKLPEDSFIASLIKLDDEADSILNGLQCDIEQSFAHIMHLAKPRVIPASTGESGETVMVNLLETYRMSMLVSLAAFNSARRAGQLPVIEDPGAKVQLFASIFFSDPINLQMCQFFAKTLGQEFLRELMGSVVRPAGPAQSSARSSNSADALDKAKKQWMRRIVVMMVCVFVIVGFLMSRLIPGLIHSFKEAKVPTPDSQ